MDTSSPLLTNAAPARLVVEGGRQYRVAPAVSIVPGVLQGSKGALLYEDEQIANTAPAWVDIPLTVYHPSDPVSGRPMSAAEKGVWERQGVGRIRESTFNGKLKQQLWFDVERTRAADRRFGTDILGQLERGDQVELSTGLYTNNVEKAGVHAPTGRPYTHIATDFVPDHLAILPGQQGACSIKDGCGVLVNRQLVVNGRTLSQVRRQHVTNGGSIPADELAAAGKALASRKSPPRPMPGYGQIFYLPDAVDAEESGAVWYVGGDGDEDGFVRLVEKTLGAVPGVHDVTCEAESFPPKDEGWVQVYPKRRDWVANEYGEDEEDCEDECDGGDFEDQEDCLDCLTGNCRSHPAEDMRVAWGRLTANCGGPGSGVPGPCPKNDPHKTARAHHAAAAHRLAKAAAAHARHGDDKTHQALKSAHNDYVARGKEVMKLKRGAEKTAPAAARVTKPAKPPTKAKTTPTDVTKQPLTADSVADAVHAAKVPDTQTGPDKRGAKFGDKVFIHAAYDAVKKDHPDLTRADFDKHLTAAQKAGKVELSRADMVEGMHPKDVAESEVGRLNGRFHFVRMPKAAGSGGEKTPESKTADKALAGKLAQVAKAHGDVDQFTGHVVGQYLAQHGHADAHGRNVFKEMVERAQKNSPLPGDAALAAQVHKDTLKKLAAPDNQTRAWLDKKLPEFADAHAATAQGRGLLSAKEFSGLAKKAHAKLDTGRPTQVKNEWSDAARQASVAARQALAASRAASKATKSVGSDTGRDYHGHAVRQAEAAVRDLGKPAQREAHATAASLHRQQATRHELAGDRLGKSPKTDDVRLATKLQEAANLHHEARRHHERAAKDLTGNRMNKQPRNTIHRVWQQLGERLGLFTANAAERHPATGRFDASVDGAALRGGRHDGWGDGRRVEPVGETETADFVEAETPDDEAHDANEEGNEQVQETGAGGRKINVMAVNANPEGHNQYTAAAKQASKASKAADSATAKASGADAHKAASKAHSDAAEAHGKAANLAKGKASSRHAEAAEGHRKSAERHGQTAGRIVDRSESPHDASDYGSSNLGGGLHKPKRISTNTAYSGMDDGEDEEPTENDDEMDGGDGGADLGDEGGGEEEMTDEPATENAMPYPPQPAAAPAAPPPDLHAVSKQAAAASLQTEHNPSFGHAQGAMKASAGGDSAGAADGHVTAATAHEAQALKARKAGDPQAAAGHDDAAALHRKAASMHLATNALGGGSKKKPAVANAAACPECGGRMEDGECEDCGYEAESGDDETTDNTTDNQGTKMTDLQLLRRAVTANKDFTSDQERKAAFAAMADDSGSGTKEARGATAKAEKSGRSSHHAAAHDAHKEAAAYHKEEGNDEKAAAHAGMAKYHAKAAKAATRNQESQAMATTKTADRRTLLANCTCAETRKVLNKLSDAELRLVVSNVEATIGSPEQDDGPAGGTGKKGKDAGYEDDDEFTDSVETAAKKTPPKQATESITNRLTADELAVWNSAARIQRREHDRLMGQLKQVVANEADPRRRQLVENRLKTRMTVEQMEELLVLAGPVANAHQHQPNFQPALTVYDPPQPGLYGPAGADLAANEDALTVNGVKGDDALPVVNWGEVWTDTAKLPSAIARRA